MVEKNINVANLNLAICDNVITNINAVKYRVATESSATYFYDILQTACIDNSIDFASLLVMLIQYNICEADLCICED